MGYKIEIDSLNENTRIINFIVDLGEDIILNDGNIKTDLYIASLLQMFWAGNCVSHTIQFDPNIDDEVFNKLIQQYSTKLKTMCFLPKRCEYYKQLPIEELTDEQYDNEIKDIKMRKSSFERYNWFSCEYSTNDIYCDNDRCNNF